jgi:hypothetical protein
VLKMASKGEIVLDAGEAAEAAATN